MKRLVILIMIMTLMVSFSTATFAETVNMEIQVEDNNMRKNLQILVDTPTSLIYTYEYQGFIYKNVETIKNDLIKSEVYKLNKEKQVYEITDKFSTNINDFNMQKGYILGNKEITPNNMVDPRTLPYKYDVYREITNDHPVWFKEVRDWYLDKNYNNFVETTTEYYQWWD